ncbi:TonB-dependent receptor [Ectothiorhodospiraceae bacterium WFHF3C12]|nr:TonB-dependent receptor [Ectothiorhodospiraceae bacterium WFHF3C12]
MITRLRQALGAALLLILAGAATAQQTTEAAERPGEISLYVFDGGRPVEGLIVRVGGESAVTDETGGVFLRVPAGRRELVVTHEGGERVLDLDLLTAEGENVQVLVTLRGAGEQPDVDIESSNPQAAGAVEAAGGPRKAAENAAAGLLRGTVRSAEQDEPVANARVFFAGVNAQARTNAQGQFQVELPPGNYSLSVIHEDFATQTVDNVRVIPEKEVTTAIELTPAGVQLQEYVVTAPYIEGSVASDISAEREASGVSEILGAEQMSRAGDSDAADALKRVTGLTIEDGKYVVIRGQPSRYTYTLWNGSPLPSPDPIKRIVPLDLFPTGVLSQIRVEKSYDPSLPGAFGGGLIGLETTGVPEEGFAEFSFGIGGNTQTTGQEGLDYEGGSQDFLGFDDGTRELPGGLTGADSQGDVEEAAKGFENNWEVSESTMGPDTSLGVSGGKTFDALGGEVGVLGALDWSRSYDYRETIKRDYALRGDGSLALRDDQVERRTDMNVDLGGLLVGAVNWEDHSLRSNTFAIRKSYKRSQITEGVRAVSQDRYQRAYLLEWNERELLAQQLIGEHDFDWVNLGWRGMYAQSSRNSPDRREYTYVRRSDGVFYFPGQSSASRNYSESDDDIYSFDTDLTFPLLDTDTWKWNVATGVSYYDQERESQTRRYSFRPTDDADLTAPPEDLLDPDDIGDTLEVSDQTQTNDEYSGEATVSGSYLKTDLDWSDTVRVMVGARRETADFSVATFQAGGSQGGQRVEAGFKQSDVLPAASITWKFLDGMQVRASTGRTISRPVLNELSPARYYDPDTGEEYLGNPDLEPAKIEAYDLRWEWYPTSREAFSLGFFTKDYTDPIEVSFVGVGGSAYLLQVQNAAGATVSGVETSMRTDFGRLVALTGLDSEWAQSIYLQANLAFIDSEVELARQDLATNQSRPLQGQADSLLNLQIGYEGERHDATLLLNRVGERLAVAGTEGRPDVYEQPVAQLDLNYTYKFSDGLKFKFSAGNLLDPTYEQLQGGRVYRSYTKGRDFGLSVSWKPWQ